MIWVNKWLWSATGVLRVALSFDTKSIVHDAIRAMQNRANESWSINERCTPDGDVESEVFAIFHDGPPQPELYMGRRTGNFIYERYAEKSHWVNRGPLAPMIANEPTRVHKLEQRAMNEKVKALRIEERRRHSIMVYEAGEAMTCQICGRLICSKTGYIAHHGYSRPHDGYQTPSCLGAQQSPLEVSNAALVTEISRCEEMVSSLAERIEAISDGALPVVVKVRPHRTEKREYPYVYSFTAEDYDAVRAASEGRLSPFDKFDDHKLSYLSAVEASLRNWKVVVSELRKRNEGWRQTRVFIDGKFKPFREAVA
jgi:hypothetical protein